MSRTSVGRREGGAPSVQVHSPAGVRELRPPTARRRRPAFDWGGRLTTSLGIAESLLRDVLGRRPARSLVAVSTADCLSRLSAEGFSVSGEEIVRRLGGPQPLAMDQDELVEHLGTIALRDEDDERLLLDELMRPCWDDRSVRH